MGTPLRTACAAGSVEPCDSPSSPPSPPAVLLALAAARATSAALVGVDLLPTPDGGYTILEVNGAVDLTRDYLPDTDIFQETVTELCCFARAVRDEEVRSSENPLPV